MLNLSGYSRQELASHIAESAAFQHGLTIREEDALREKWLSMDRDELEDKFREQFDDTETDAETYSKENRDA